MGSYLQPFPLIAKTVIDGHPVQTVGARDLHAFLEVGTSFKDWIARRVSEYGFREEEDFCSFLSESSGGRPAREYALTLDMAKELAMVERNDQGKRARQYFIECERRAKEPMAEIDVRDPSQLAKIAIQLIEVNKELETRAVRAESQVEAARPKTQFFDSFANADGLYGLQNGARILGEPPGKFVGWLKQKYLFYQGASLIPRADFIKLGIFEVKVTVIDEKARHQTFITPKGIQYLARQLNKAPDLFAAVA